MGIRTLAPVRMKGLKHLPGKTSRATSAQFQVPQETSNANAVPNPSKLSLSTEEDQNASKVAVFAQMVPVAHARVFEEFTNTEWYLKHAHSRLPKESDGISLHCNPFAALQTDDDDDVVSESGDNLGIPIGTEGVSRTTLFSGDGSTRPRYSTKEPASRKGHARRKAGSGIGADAKGGPKGFRKKSYEARSREAAQLTTRARAFRGKRAFNEAYAEYAENFSAKHRWFRAFIDRLRVLRLPFSVRARICQL